MIHRAVDIQGLRICTSQCRVPKQSGLWSIYMNDLTKISWRKQLHAVTWMCIATDKERSLRHHRQCLPIVANQYWVIELVEIANRLGAAFLVILWPLNPL